MTRGRTGLSAADLELFTETVRRAVATSTGPEALDAALRELGWHDALAADRQGAVGALFEALGETSSVCGALDAVLCDALGMEASEPAAVVLPPFATTGRVPPGALAEGRCKVDGMATGAIGRATLAVVVVGAEPGPVALTLATEALTLQHLEGIDPSFGLHRVTGDFAIDAHAAPTDWDAALAVGHRALAHELVGAGRAMLGLARVHAMDREQFGRPIAGFQAVRHRLAESLVAIEAAAGVVESSWDDPDDDDLAAMAKSVAGHSARTVTRHCQQVLAGIGFTTEHPFHRLLRRSMLLDQLLGSSAVLARGLGEELLATRVLPAPPAL